MQQAVCVRKKKTHTHKKSAPPQTHDEIQISAATATTSRRRSTKHVPRVSPYSPASIDPGFVEVGLVQLSQSVKNTKSVCESTFLEIYFKNCPEGKTCGKFLKKWQKCTSSKVGFDQMLRAVNFVSVLLAYNAPSICPRQNNGL